VVNSLEDHEVVKEGVGVVLPSEDDELIVEMVHGVTVPRHWRLPFRLELLPREGLDVLQVHLPDIIQIAPLLKMHYLLMGSQRPPKTNMTASTTVAVCENRPGGCSPFTAIWSTHCIFSKSSTRRSWERASAGHSPPSPQW
jgi:hypothetical protein